MRDGDIRVIIIDNDPAFREHIKRILRAEPGFALVGEADNGSDGLHLITELGADLVMIDYLIPEIDGLSVIRRAKNNFYFKAPEYMMMSAYYTDKLSREAAALGVECLLQKPINKVCLEERLRLYRANGSFYILGSNAADRTALLLKEITDLMFANAFPIDLKGFAMLREAVFFAVVDPECAEFLTKNLYHKVAKRFSTDAACVERNIRSAVVAAWKRYQRGANCAYFGKIFNKCPTNREVISAFADSVRINHVRTGGMLF